MNASTQFDSPQKRGKGQSLVFATLAALHVFAFFYKSSYDLSHLLQAIGFLLFVPPTYFAPSGQAFRKGRKSTMDSWLRVATIAGVLLLLAAVFAKFRQW